MHRHHAVLIAALLWSGSVAAEPIVIVHPGLTCTELERAELKRIYQGSRRQLEGVSIEVTLLDAGKAHETFPREILAKTPQQLRNHWRKLVFSGQGRLPRSFGSESAMVLYVAATPGAIGYIDSTTPHPGVRVLALK